MSVGVYSGVHKKQINWRYPIILDELLKENMECPNKGGRGNYYKKALVLVLAGELRNMVFLAVQNPSQKLKKHMAAELSQPGMPTMHLQAPM